MKHSFLIQYKRYSLNSIRKINSKFNKTWTNYSYVCSVAIAYIQPFLIYIHHVKVDDKREVLCDAVSEIHKFRTSMINWRVHCTIPSGKGQISEEGYEFYMCVPFF